MGEARKLAEELGLTMLLASAVARTSGEISLFAGDAVAAERELRPACETLERMGDWGHYGSVVPYLADSLLLQGRGEEAEPLVQQALRWTLDEDVDAQVGLRRVTAKLAARRGEVDEAERQATAAVARAVETDSLHLGGDAYRDLAEVLELAGKTLEAREALEQALALYERKGNLVMAERMRARLATV